MIINTCLGGNTSPLNILIEDLIKLQQLKKLSIYVIEINFANLNNNVSKMYF